MIPLFTVEVNLEVLQTVPDALVQSFGDVSEVCVQARAFTIERFQ